MLCKVFLNYFDLNSNPWKLQPNIKPRLQMVCRVWKYAARPNLITQSLSRVPVCYVASRVRSTITLILLIVLYYNLKAITDFNCYYLLCTAPTLVNIFLEYIIP